MWSLWTNDLSRNLMYFFGILYSFFGTLVYILVVRLKKYGENLLPQKKPTNIFVIITKVETQRQNKHTEKIPSCSY